MLMISSEPVLKLTATPCKISGVKLLFSINVPVHALELDIQPFGLSCLAPLSQRRGPIRPRVDLDAFRVSHKGTLGLVPSTWPLPCPWLCRAISARVSHLRSFPHECLCLYPLSDEFDQARWSQRTFLISLSDGIAVELRERSLRQASPFRDTARHLADSASIGACRRPTLGLDPLCWRYDQLLHASRRGGYEASAPSTRSQSAVSPERGGSPAGLSECGDSDMRVLSAATREVVRSSATPAGAAVETSHRYATLWMFCTLLRRRGLNSKTSEVHAQV